MGEVCFWAFVYSYFYSFAVYTTKFRSCSQLHLLLTKRCKGMNWLIFSAHVTVVEVPHVTIQTVFNGRLVIEYEFIVITSTAYQSKVSFWLVELIYTLADLTDTTVQVCLQGYDILTSSSVHFGWVGCS